MGWTEGDGLGKNRTGEVDPLTLDIKFDKRGLMAAEEGMAKKNKRGDVLTLTGCKDFSGKHPVSALIELSTKRRWGQPSFVQAFEVGPPHRKQYIFKVSRDCGLLRASAFRVFCNRGLPQTDPDSYGN
jgi:hypothetical protein